MFNNDASDWRELAEEPNLDVVLASGDGDDIERYLANVADMSGKTRQLFVFDDCDRWLLNKQTALECFTRLSSHTKIAIFATLHSAVGGKTLRALQLQCSHMLLYPNKFDRNCVALSRSLFPGHPQRLCGSLAISAPYQPLALSLSPYPPLGEQFQIFSNLLAKNGRAIRIFLDGGGGDEREKRVGGGEGRRRR